MICHFFFFNFFFFSCYSQRFVLCAYTECVPAGRGHDDIFHADVRAKREHVRDGNTVRRALPDAAPEAAVDQRGDERVQVAYDRHEPVPVGAGARRPTAKTQQRPVGDRRGGLRVRADRRLAVVRRQRGEAQDEAPVRRRHRHQRSERLVQLPAGRVAVRPVRDGAVRHLRGRQVRGEIRHVQILHAVLRMDGTVRVQVLHDRPDHARHCETGTRATNGFRVPFCRFRRSGKGRRR